jgi:choline dehydrogenase-like flavoprotein
MEADVCIVGAGPAGLATACSLIDSGRSVVLLEAGADKADTTTLPRVELDHEDPYPHGDIGTSRAAMIGGSAGLWAFQMIAAGDSAARSLAGCRYVPLQPLDFTARPAIGTPGWPIGAADLDPWYEAAHQLCGIGPYRYDAEFWSDVRAQPLPLEGMGVVSSMFQFGPATAWTTDARARLEAAANVTVRTGARVQWLQCSPRGDRVSGVIVTGAAGGELVQARSVVLAAGGLETVRLLLDTGRHGDQVPGDKAGLVGSGFMEHPLVRGGLLITDRHRDVIRRLSLYATRRVRGTYVSGKLTLDDDLIGAEGLLACSALLVPRDASYGSAGAQALARLRSPSGRRDPWTVKARNGLRLLLDAPSVARAVLAARRQPTIDRADWSDIESGSRYSVFELLHQTEQGPDDSNRLTLADERDELDRSTLRLSWRWAIEEQQRIGRSRDLFARAFRDVGIGEVVNTDWDAGRPRLLGGTHHHLGTTRMSADPAQGVVDPHCRVHGMENLFVASGSVFPSAGFVNPTLTVVALALRLGSQLAGDRPARNRWEPSLQHQAREKS